MITLTQPRLELDEGSVVVMSGLDEDGDRHRFAVDHRMAQAIIDDDTLWNEVYIEDWQLLGG